MTPFASLQLLIILEYYFFDSFMVIVVARKWQWTPCFMAGWKVCETATGRCDTQSHSRMQWQHASAEMDVWTIWLNCLNCKCVTAHLMAGLISMKLCVKERPSDCVDYRFRINIRYPDKSFAFLVVVVVVVVGINLIRWENSDQMKYEWKFEMWAGFYFTLTEICNIKRLYSICSSH